jgi:large subunit ribosomal protein L21
MSFAIIQTGGKQYKVSASEILKVEKIESPEGKTIEFKNVLFLNDDKSTEIGNPNIQGAKVEATILKNTKNRTVLVFKKRRRKNSRKKYGHRQPISLIRITKIFSKSGKLISEAGPQQQKTKETVKGDQARKKQILEAEKTKIEEQTKIRKNIKKVDIKSNEQQKKKRLASSQEKIITKKSAENNKKIVSKKKPLTTKKK